MWVQSINNFLQDVYINSFLLVLTVFNENTVFLITRVGTDSLNTKSIQFFFIRIRKVKIKYVMQLYFVIIFIRTNYYSMTLNIII